jgi:hypothetical protein
VRPQAIEKVTSQKVWDLLDSQDNDSQIAWKNEDPDLPKILQWIKDHPQKEKA